jgi:hypothetical protein
MNAIEQWIKNKMPYAEGVILYETLPSHNKVLLKNFKKKQSALLHEKLKYELKKYLVPVVVIKNATPEVEPKPKDIVQYIEHVVVQEKTKQALYFHELPEELRPVLLEANMLFKEICLLKVQLNDLPAHAEIKALEIITAIASKRKQNANCWKKLDYWQEHKTAPKEVVSSFENVSPAQLLRKEQYHYAAISKLETRLKANRVKIKSVTNVSEHNKLQRAIAKQESNLIVKNDELLMIKKLING